MTSINMPNVNFMSDFAGIAANPPQDFSVFVPNQNIGAAGAVTYVAQTVMPNSAQLPDVQVQYSGVSSNSYLLDGPSIFTQPGQFTITSTLSYVGATLYVSNFILNTSGGTLSLPAITINCRGFLYDVPY